MKAKDPVLFLIRDGWGYSENSEHNFINASNAPFCFSLAAQYPRTLLKCSGEAVGLPKGYQGNSEVGHMTIGGGRVVYQSLPRILHAIEDRTFFSNAAFLAALDHASKNNGYLHLMGLAQFEGVHSHLDHLFALLDLCKEKGFRKVLVHVITDGRDAPPKAGIDNLCKIQEKLNVIGFGEIATISGRYYAMDRDKRFERTQKYYQCVKDAQAAEKFSLPFDYLKGCYAQEVTDEFIIPACKEGYCGLSDSDSLIFFNFRTDRTRQITQALIEEEFTPFARSKFKGVFVAMTQYYTPMPCLVAFTEEKPINFLGEVVSQAGLKQLRISETEKYAHVTFFFNGQIEKPFENEQRILINSPKVATYDLQPQMAAPEIAQRLCGELDKKEYDLVVTNLVNADMVGHTAKKEAIEVAIKAVDNACKDIVTAALQNGYTVFVFADHGNAEDKSELTATSHTTNPVEFVLVSRDAALAKAKLKADGELKDIAPTALQILSLPQPREMTGQSLITT